MAKARDVVVRFLADVNPFVRDTEKVERAYADMATDADKAADAGESSARRLARAYDKAGDSIRRDSKAAGRDVKAGFADTGKEAGAEFASNLGEAVSSGDISGALSGTAGGLAATFGAAGPIGIAFAALATAGALAFSTITGAAEKAKEAAQTAFDELLNGADKEARFRARLEESFGTYEAGLAEIARVADLTGIPIDDIADALSAGGEPARKMAAQLKLAGDAAIKAAEGTASLQEDAVVTWGHAKEFADNLTRAADATDRAAAAEERRGNALRTSSTYFAGAYGPGSSTYRGQVPQAPPLYGTGTRP